MIIEMEEAEQIVNEDHNDWELVLEKVVDTTRWETIYEGVFLNTKTNKHYMTSFNRGSTEMQETELFYGEADFTEVELIEKTIMSWEPVK